MRGPHRQRVIRNAEGPGEALRCSVWKRHLNPRKNQKVESNRSKMGPGEEGLSEEEEKNLSGRAKEAPHTLIGFEETRYQRKYRIDILCHSISERDVVRLRHWGKRVPTIPAKGKALASNWGITRWVNRETHLYTGKLFSPTRREGLRGKNSGKWSPRQHRGETKLQVLVFCALN